ncbi:MAG: hypothetical protein DWQ37_03385 [Planctomycetota bacterium]|nr:MAG: hypothetical protein DWQ37_03385 [Planctomycetota bacterium]
MVSEEERKRLVCPEDHSDLEFASSELIEKINRGIAARQVINHGGIKLEEPLDGGLVRADRTRLYAIVDDIPRMLIDEAIPLDQPALKS